MNRILMRSALMSFCIMSTPILQNVHAVPAEGADLENTRMEDGTLRDAEPDSELGPPQSLYGEPAGAFDRGVYEDDDGNARTVNGVVIRDMLGDPIPYSEELRVETDGAGNVTGVTDGQVCYPPPGGNGYDFMNDDGSSNSTLLDPLTSEPSEVEQARQAAIDGEPLPIAEPTTEVIQAYNDNLPIPYRPVSEDCASDFMGPPAPGSDCSRIAGRDEEEASEPEPEPQPVATSGPDDGLRGDPEPEPTEEPQDVDEQPEESEEIPPVPRERPEEPEEDVDEIVVTPDAVVESSPDEDEEAAEDPSTLEPAVDEPVPPSEHDPKEEEDFSSFGKSLNEGADDADSELESADGLEPQPDVIDDGFREPEDAAGEDRSEAGEPVESGGEQGPDMDSPGFWSQGESSLTEEEVREQGLPDSEEMDQDGDFDTFMSDLEQDAEVVDNPQSGSDLPPKSSEPTVASNEPAPKEEVEVDQEPLSSLKLEESVRVANLELQDGEETGGRVGRMGMVTSDGQQIQGIAVRDDADGDGDSPQRANTRAELLQRGLTPETLDECDELFGLGNYDECLDENLNFGIEGMMLQNSGGLRLQTED